MVNISAYASYLSEIISFGITDIEIIHYKTLDSEALIGASLQVEIVQHRQMWLYIFMLEFYHLQYVSSVQDHYI